MPVFIGNLPCYVAAPCGLNLVRAHVMALTLFGFHDRPHDFAVTKCVKSDWLRLRFSPPPLAAHAQS